MVNSLAVIVKHLYPHQSLCLDIRTMAHHCLIQEFPLYECFPRLSQQVIDKCRLLVVLRVIHAVLSLGLFHHILQPYQPVFDLHRLPRNSVHAFAGNIA